MASSKSKEEMLLEVVEKIEKDKCDHGFKQWVEEKLKGSETLKILATGKTGSGKSTLLNGLVGSKFVVGHSLKAQTAFVEKYEYKMGNLKVIVWDSPGLQDKTNDDTYLKDMVETTKKEGGVDLLFYCIRMDETRSDVKNHFFAIHTITNAFGPAIWKNALIVLTFANMYEYQLQVNMEPGENLQPQFNRRIKEWKDNVITELLEMRVDATTATSIPIQPAGIYRQLHLPGHRYWASLLWAHVFAAVKDGSKSILLTLNMERITTEDKIPENMSEKRLENQKLVATPTFEEVIAGALKEEKLKLGIAGVGATTAIASAGYAAATTLTLATGTGIIGGGGLGIGLTAYALYKQYQKIKEGKQKKNA